MARPRRRGLLLIAALAALLAMAPFLPDAHGPGPALRPSDSGPGGASEPLSARSLSEADRAEIDRVVAEGITGPSVTAKAAPASLIDAQVRCARFQGQQYCLHVGWTDAAPDTIRAALARHASAAATSAGIEATGDLDLTAALRATAAKTTADRARDERLELTRAALAAAKVAELRREVLGEPTAQVAGAAKASSSASPTASPTAGPTAGTTKSAEDYPQKDWILKGSQMLEQHRSYWCGPTSMQAIAWGWSGDRRSQRHWAGRLGTTSSGTSITDIVRVINAATGWDNKDYAGPYVVLDIKKWSYSKWYLLMLRHIHDYQAPVVLHPILLTRYFPYLDDDASGHYQVGRGFRQRGDKPDLLGYFEPWNQQRFDPSEPYIERVQWRRAYLSYRANKAHYLHNVGV